MVCTRHTLIDDNCSHSEHLREELTGDNHVCLRVDRGEVASRVNADNPEYEHACKAKRLKNRAFAISPSARGTRPSPQSFESGSCLAQFITRRFHVFACTVPPLASSMNRRTFCANTCFSKMKLAKRNAQTHAHYHIGISLSEYQSAVKPLELLAVKVRNKCPQWHKPKWTWTTNMRSFALSICRAAHHTVSNACWKLLLSTPLNSSPMRAS